MQILLASHNAHKVQEVGAILAGSPFDLVGMDAFPEVPEAPEDGDTFEVNALAKARFVFARTGIPTVADDSGLEVETLGLAPGVHSKRFTPQATHAANNRHLLHRLDGVTDRRARFRCVIALVTGGGEALAEGRCEGTIAHGLRGSGGFGYDPLFLPDELPGRTLAEVGMDDKNRISHRGRAFRQLPGLVERLLVAR